MKEKINTYNTMTAFKNNTCSHISNTVLDTEQHITMKEKTLNQPKNTSDTSQPTKTNCITHHTT